MAPLGVSLLTVGIASAVSRQERWPRSAVKALMSLAVGLTCVIGTGCT